MSDPTVPRPRFELEDETIARLEPELILAPRPTRRGPGTVALLLTGLAVLVCGFAALQAGNFVAAQFARSATLGWLTLAVAAAGLLLIGWAVWRELRETWRLQAVDALRTGLVDPATRREAAQAWLATLPDHAELLPAIRVANDPDAILVLLQAGPGAALRARAQALGRRAAMQVFALTAAVPSPAFDALAVAWRGARLMREIAALHGLRPGLFATLGLLRRTASAATLVAASNFATDAMVRAAVSNPLLGHVAGDMAGAGIAARRMLTLARAAEAACSPLPPP